MHTSISIFEPLLPQDPKGHLDSLSARVLQESSRLSGALHPVTRQILVKLVRTMNCYYSNLIEGHHTLPLDIERALKRDYATDPQKRDLQLESLAHIMVQELIEKNWRVIPIWIFLDRIFCVGFIKNFSTDFHRPCAL